MNIRVTIIVLVLAVVAGVVAIVKLRAPSSNSTTLPGSGARLLDPDAFDPDAVTRITLDRRTDAGDERSVFEKTGEQWWQTEPLRFEMVTWSIRMLATSAADLTIQQTIPRRDLKGDLSAEKLGLEPAMAVITYDTAEGQHRLELGRIAVGGNAYLRREAGGDVYVVEDRLHRRVFEASPREWRVRNLMSGVTTDAARLTIERGQAGQTVSLARISGKWRLTLPIETAADEAAVSRFISDLGSMQVESFVEDQPDDYTLYGLLAPWATITVETDKVDADGRTTTTRDAVLLGHAFDVQDAGRYAKRADQPAVVKVRAADVNALTPDPASLVSRTVVALPRQEIRALVVDGQEGRFRLERQPEDWVITLEDGSTAPALTSAVTGLLDQLTLPCQSVEIASKGAAVEGAYLGKVAVEGFSSNTVAEVTCYRRQRGDAVEIVFADGSGALRSRPLVNVPDLVADSFASTTPTGGGGGGEPILVEPVK